MTVTWRLLGPTELRVDGVAVPPPPPASRALLARLLLSAGRVVPVEHLVDVLWGADLPADPANALQTRVAKLRRALASSGLDSGIVQTRAPGYLIDVEPESVDAVRFEQLVGTARRTVVEGDDGAARAVFEEALQLWAGPALADLGDAEWVRVERVRLEELLVAVQEERLELLTAVEPAAAVPEIEALVATHPLRERLTQLLMLALYRRGRQADALAAYERLRQTLADELGLDPTPEIQALSQAILRQEVSLHRATPEPAPTGKGIPDRLTSFVGRDTEVAELVTLSASSRLLTLTGMGGLGKTSLALEVARRVESSDRCAVHLVHLSGVDRDADVAEALAEQLGIPISPGSSTVDQVTAALGDSRSLLVLDNCEHVVDAAAYVVEQMLVRCPGLSVLATSREALAVPGEVQWPVAPLPVEEAAAGGDGQSAAVQLFIDRARQVSPALALDDASMDEVRGICRDLDGVPLAIELAAARTRMLALPQLRSMLAERLDVLGGDERDAGRSTLRATLDWSYGMLSPQEQVLLERLSVFRGGWTLSAAEQVCSGGDLGRGDVLPILSRLVDRSLVVPDPASGRFRLLVIVRHYAWEQLSQRPEVSETVSAHLGWCIEFAEQHEPMLRSGTGYPVFAAEAANLRVAIARSLQDGTRDVERGLQLATSLVWFWYQGLRDEGVRTIEALLAAGAEAKRARASALQGLGLLLVYYPTPRSQAAARESLALFEQLGDDIEAAKSRLIVAQEAMYGLAEAAPYRQMIEQSRSALADLDGGWWQAITYYVDAMLHLRDGEFDEAVRKGEHAIAMLRTTGDRASLSALLSHIGIALRMSGDRSRAVTRLREALSVADDAPARHTGAFALVHLGHALLDGDQDTAEAIECLAEGDALARQVSNPRCRAWAAWGRARLAARAGDTTDALTEVQLANELFAGREFPWALRSLDSFAASLHGDDAHLSVGDEVGAESGSLDG